MKIADYIVDTLIEKGVTDVFGVPGGSVLDFVYALDRRKKEIALRLNYHEQASAFAACGYAQITGKPGVAYGTKGPGFTNMLTGIADAHHNSIPALFITAHGAPTPDGLRFENVQEIDTVGMTAKITKYAARVTDPRDARAQINRAFEQMLSGRKGAVMLDFATSVFQSEIDAEASATPAPPAAYDSLDTIVATIQAEIEKARRPVLLIGDGINQSGTQSLLEKLVQNARVPVLSSRFAQDVIPGSEYYFGAIGSHATRYSNFVLSKCDLAVALGNRMAYNPNSKSFGAYARRTRTIRVDIDKAELGRQLPNMANFHADLKTLMPALAKITWQATTPAGQDWLKTCNELKNALFQCDTDYPVTAISEIIKSTANDAVLVSDVGNNEMWLSRAYACSGCANRILFSNNFGSLGCSLPKAIGAWHASRKRVICFAGDMGFMMNSQELQFIARENLPMTVVILNTRSSAMIREAQRKKGYAHNVHTTPESGYSVPAFDGIARAFGIPYFGMEPGKPVEAGHIPKDRPAIVEIPIDPGQDVLPFLPAGRPFQDFDPRLPRETHEHLDAI